MSNKQNNEWILTSQWNNECLSVVWAGNLDTTIYPTAFSYTKVKNLPKQTELTDNILPPTDENGIWVSTPFPQQYSVLHFDTQKNMYVF